MTHLWLRAEPRANEQRTGLTPEGAATLQSHGIAITVEESADRIIPTAAYRAAGCTIAPAHGWSDAPQDAIIFGLKELPDEDTPLVHRHVMFGHAFKDQPAGQRLLKRFAAGGGTLYDLEYLLDETGRRVAAFGYWAGFAGAAVALKCWIAQAHGGIAGPVGVSPNAETLTSDMANELAALVLINPNVLIIGALGRVGSGASAFCKALNLPTTLWDLAETAHGGPFPEILQHAIFLNAILAHPGCPVFVPATAKTDARNLRVIGDIACDPDSDFSPIKVYDRTTTWDTPALRVHATPLLDVTAIDNLPAMLPLESSQDYAAQLLPSLLSLPQIDAGVWGRAKATYDLHRR